MSVIEVAVLLGSDWRSMEQVTDTNLPGSVRSVEPEGRFIYLFGWMEGRPGVYRAYSEFDEAITEERPVDDDVEQLVDLQESSPYVLKVIHPRFGPLTIRFQYQD